MSELATQLINKSIGNNFKAKREQLGLTQDHVAQALDLSRPSIINIEKGTHGATITTLLKICLLFNCVITDLISVDIQVELKPIIKESSEEKIKRKIHRLEKKLIELKSNVTR